MRVFKKVLYSFAWLNLKSRPKAVSVVPPSTTSRFETVHFTASASATPARKPLKKALLIGVAEVRPYSPALISEKPVEEMAGTSQGHEVKQTDNSAPTTLARTPLAVVREKDRRRSGTAKLSDFRPPVTKKLVSAHNDVGLMKKALISWYGYKPSNITVLIDDDKPGRIKPTRDNILAAIDNLVQDVEAGDTVFFHFAGHGSQQDTAEVDEEDRKNEVILTCDGCHIVDNELHQRLVRPLPPGSTLIAVCDACHSGSMLDLQHFRCNSVYVPWISKGERRTRMEQNKTKRGYAWVPTDPAFINRVWGGSSSTIDGILKSNDSSTTHETLSELENRPLAPRQGFEGFSQHAPLRPAYQSHAHSHSHSTPHHVTSPLPSSRFPPVRQGHIPTNSLSITTNMSATAWMPWLSGGKLEDKGNIMDTPQDLYCTGFCADDGDINAQYLNIVGCRPHADVICLSSSRDSQRTWQDAKGRSMTYKLYQILKKNRNPTLTCLLTSISHSVHKSYLELHNRSREHKEGIIKINRTRRTRGELEVSSDCVLEMDNFQEPVLSSFVPLPRDKIWNP